MALKADLRHFLDEEGNELELTGQASTHNPLVLVNAVTQTLLQGHFEFSITN